MSKHTPGPWKVHFAGSMDALVIGAEETYVTEMIGCHQGPEKFKADATLIAAAPDLLEALALATHELNAIRARDGAPQHIDWDRGRPIQTSSCTEEFWGALTEQCFAAIKKAEGR